MKIELDRRDFTKAVAVGLGVAAVPAIKAQQPPAQAPQGPKNIKIGLSTLAWNVSTNSIDNFEMAVKDASELSFVKEAKADAPDLVTCWKQAEPARQLPNLHLMPIMVLTSEASYHAPYDHCTVKYLRQAGVEAAWVKLAELGIKGNSHVMMQEKNSKEIAAVIYQWLDKALPGAQIGTPVPIPSP